MMQQVGGLMFGAQVGQGLGGLAQEVLSATDIGIPIGPAGVAALRARRTSPPSGRASSGRPTRCGSTSRCARPPTSGCSRTSRGCASTCSTPSRPTRAASASTCPRSSRRWAASTPPIPQGIQDALSGGLFTPQQTPEQQNALRRLETLLALVEGWVDTVVTAAAGERDARRRRAARGQSRRRRAGGGPAEQTFATLVGLELRPRRLRDAATLWWGVTEKRGISGRDAIWSHPDLLPTADDLDDPLGFGDKVLSAEDFVAPDDLSELFGADDATSGTDTSEKEPPETTTTPSTTTGRPRPADLPATG